MSKPIPIGGARSAQRAPREGAAPHAPYLGSLGSGPRALEGALPELSLPDSTPEAFSMVRRLPPCGAPSLCALRADVTRSLATPA